MTTTTGDPSSLKTPATLSGGDLVSRLLAATPPYLYNVPLTPNSFFFSEMLRSFVQAKTEANNSIPSPSPSLGRRRKRSWKEARDRPLELTTKEKSPQPQNSGIPQEKYFHGDFSENRYKNDTFEEIKNGAGNNVEQKISGFGAEVLKPLDENRANFVKHNRHYFDDASRPLAPTADSITQQEVERKNYEDKIKINGEVNFMAESKNKMDFSARNLLSSVPRLDEVKNFGIPNGLPANPEFIPNPLWYPPYPIPQSYPGIDPLHFFIDLRVSGHIWDRKMNERQLPFKSKHCSAFSVPQSKEFSNRPLNLTRDEAGNSKRCSEENYRGTHFIMKNLTKTFKDIAQSCKDEKSGRNEEQEQNGDNKNSEDDEKRSFKTSNRENNNRNKDLTALIGLELVVDYVKEPKEEPVSQQSPQNVELE